MIFRGIQSSRILVILFAMTLLGCDSLPIEGLLESSSSEPISDVLQPPQESVSPEFITVWRTSAPSETITLPLVVGYNYDFTVDWGDGSPVDLVTSNVDPDITHTYALAGDYTVTISGTLEAFSFNNGGDKDKLLRVENMGETGWLSLENAFYGCTNMTDFVGAGDTSQVTTMQGLLHEATSLSNVNFENFSTESVTNMAQMFRNTPSLTTIDVTGFDTSEVTNMLQMFDITWVTSLDLSNFNTSKVQNMIFMFSEINGLTSLDLSSFDTSSVLTMGGMFQIAPNLTTLDISSFDTSNVNDMSNMFNDARQLSSLDVSHFDTSSVGSMDGMFANMSSLTSLDTTDFDLGLSGGSTNVFLNTSGVTVTCNHGTFFGETCN